MKHNRANERLEAITTDTLIAGIDIAKYTHWARFVDYRGMEVGKAFEISKNRSSFNNIVSEIRRICNSNFLKSKYNNVIGVVLAINDWYTNCTIMSFPS